MRAPGTRPKLLRTRSRKPRPEEGRVFVDVGHIVGVFGLRGHVKVQMLSDFPERFAKGEKLWMRGEPHKIIDVSFHRGQARILIEGVLTVDAAESLRGELLQVPLDERPELEEGDYYASDLQGMEVVDEQGTFLGTVDQVVLAPAQDLLQIGEILVPMVREFVRDISVPDRRIVVRLIPGMRPGESPEEVR